MSSARRYSFASLDSLPEGVARATRVSSHQPSSCESEREERPPLPAAASATRPDPPASPPPHRHTSTGQHSVLPPHTPHHHHHVRPCPGSADVHPEGDPPHRRRWIHRSVGTRDATHPFTRTQLRSSSWHQQTTASWEHHIHTRSDTRARYRSYDRIRLLARWVHRQSCWRSHASSTASMVLTVDAMDTTGHDRTRPDTTLKGHRDENGPKSVPTYDVPLWSNHFFSPLTLFLCALGALDSLSLRHRLAHPRSPQARTP